MSQYSSELGVLQTVCGLLKGCTKGWDPQNKGSLVAFQAHGVWPLCIYQCIIGFFKNLFCDLLHHIFISTLLFTDTPRPFLESMLSPHHLSIVSQSLPQEQKLTNNNVASLLSWVFNVVIRYMLPRQRHVYYGVSFQLGVDALPAKLALPIGAAKLSLWHCSRNKKSWILISKQRGISLPSSYGR